MSFVSFQHADRIGDRFLELLKKNGIQPPIGSAMEDELLSLTQLIEVTKQPDLARGQREVGILHAAAGLHDLAAKVLSVEPLPEFVTFLPHLRLIAETKVPAASLGQNVFSGPYDDTARKMAELYMGCLAAHVGTQIALDSPTAAKGDNPDVMFTVEEASSTKGPERWTLAIKTISSRQGQTIFERIKDGVAQIDDPKCSAQKGIIVINAKNALDHDALWDASFPDLDNATKALREQLTNLADSAAANRPQTEWDELFKKKVVRPVLFLGQSVVRLPTPAGDQTPTSLKMLLAYDANGTLDPYAHRLACIMNDRMQNIRLGIPGGTASNPS